MSYQWRCTTCQWKWLSDLEAVSDLCPWYSKFPSDCSFTKRSSWNIALPLFYHMSMIFQKRYRLLLKVGYIKIDYIVVNEHKTHWTKCFCASQYYRIVKTFQRTGIGESIVHVITAIGVSTLLKCCFRF